MPANPTSAKAVTVFLVEDDDVDAMGVKRALTQRRIVNSLVRARDGVEALEMLREGKIERPYLVLLDLNMPRMGGLEFLKTVREDECLKSMVVFALTTSKSDEDMIEAYNYNVAGYIVKSELTSSFDRLVDMLDGYWQIVDLPR